MPRPNRRGTGGQRREWTRERRSAWNSGRQQTKAPRAWRGARIIRAGLLEGGEGAVLQNHGLDMRRGGGRAVRGKAVRGEAVCGKAVLRPAVRGKAVLGPTVCGKAVLRPAVRGKTVRNFHC